MEPERSMTSARFTGRRLEPGTSAPIRSTVAKTSELPAGTYGRDRRLVIVSEPGVPCTGRGGVGGGVFTATTGSVLGRVTWGRPSTRAVRARPPARDRKRTVRFMRQGSLRGRRGPCLYESSGGKGLPPAHESVTHPARQMFPAQKKGELFSPKVR